MRLPVRSDRRTQKAATIDVRLRLLGAVLAVCAGVTALVVAILLVRGVLA
jgi:hypothetical protein